MSMPSFPSNANTPTREEAINQIISSIAMEELGLSHIINAEGEKLQYALGTIPGMPEQDEPLTIDELLKLNESIQKTLSGTMMNQYLLKEKLLNALSASVLVGPPGPPGPQGPATIDLAPPVTLEAGANVTVENIGTAENVILRFGIPRGADGEDGETPTVEVAATQTLEPGENANVISTPTATGIELTFQIPRGADGVNGTDGTDGTDGLTPTVVVAATQTVEPGIGANVTTEATPTGVALTFQIPRGTGGAPGDQGPPGNPGADGRTPVIGIAATQTLAPGENANVLSTPTATGIDLTFQIPRGADGAPGTPGADGADGTAVITGIQAELFVASAQGAQIVDGEVVPLNRLVTASGTDISFDDTTGQFTVNPAGINTVLMIHWSIFAEGTISADPMSITLHVGTNTYTTTAPRTEMLVSGSTMAVVSGTDPILVYLSNTSDEIISLSDIPLQGQMNIMGFRPPV